MMQTLMNLCVLAASLTGFVLLALTTDKQGPRLLQRAAGGRDKHVLRVLGWSLLVVALVLAFQGWGASVGPVIWLGWLNMTGATLAFAIPYYTRSMHLNDRSGKLPTAMQLLPPVRSLIWRAPAGAIVILAPVILLGAVLFAPVIPVMRADALTGKAGPWAFTIAEYDTRSPLRAVGDSPAKAFQIRFCGTCDTEIRAAYLSINRPHSLREAGTAFLQASGDRVLDIRLPDNSGPQSELWLTVEGKDRAFYYASWRLEELSPATARWFANERMQKP